MIPAHVVVARSTKNVVENKRGEGVQIVIWEVELPELEDQIGELRAKAKEMGVYL